MQTLRILIVDDVVVQRKMLGRLLATAGYDVEISGSGEDALQKVLTGDFDILITDRDMPGLDGTELCRRVRDSDLANGYVFIILLTGRDTVNDLVSGLESGADMYVAKSSDPAELLACLKTGIRILNLERALRRAKATDGLLDVYRRDYLETYLPREIERAHRYGFSLGLLMADLDWFKRINDEHGHAAGDQTLREFCIRACSCLRQSDWMARYGGEEFVVVLPHSDLSAARQVAEKIRVECASRPILACGASLEVTVSLGVAVLGPGEDTKAAAAALLQRADAALYQSKRDGRNRVSLAPSV